MRRYPLYYTGHSCNEQERFRASSGGIGTAITSYLLRKDEFDTSITFVFDRESCMYKPHIIHNAEEINNCGSIYQDINIYHYVKQHISDIGKGVVLTCPPCQVDSIRQLLEHKNIKCFIISFCCSGQTIIEGTWKLYETLGIDKAEVVDMHYRGNGWPGGIQITLKNGKTIKKANYTEPWVTIHKSWFYRPTRCCYCKHDTSHTADISLADPWLDEFKKNDNIGNTLFLVNTHQGKEAITQTYEYGLIEIETSCSKVYAIAQKNNLCKKERAIKQARAIKVMLFLVQKNWYKRIFTRNFQSMRHHLTIKKVIFHLLAQKNK